MPKIKTHSGAKKRFKTTKRKRNLRKTAVADVTNQKQCKRLVPYK